MIRMLSSSRQPPPPPDPAVLGYAIAHVEGTRIRLTNCDVVELEDARRELGEWQKRGRGWQLVEVRAAS